MSSFEDDEEEFGNDELSTRFIQLFIFSTLLY